MTAKHVAVATVTSDAFVLGTLVTLWSFVRSNSWFKGDIHVFTEELSTDNRALLEDAFPGIRFEAPSAAITRRLDALIANRPDLLNRRTRFLSLETFRLDGCGRLLFCDSDLLFTGSIAPLFEIDAALVACPDGATIRAAGRDSETFSRAESGVPTSFNAGLMVVDPARLPPDTYDRLVASVDTDVWRTMATHHTDQFLLNRMLGGAVTLVGAEYNLLLSHRAATFRRDEVRVAEARVLHFNGPAKPWRPETMLKAARRDAGMLTAWRLWQQALERIAAENHLARAAR